ncbi:MAG: DUF2441 domain-containing protein, partial [Bacilli bacterium]|nr:DUF2441 domain-containing protein [Bacilli bacterium]
FMSNFYENVLLREKLLSEKYQDYNIDEVIKGLELMEEKKNTAYLGKHVFSSTMNGYYIFRRELALEEGRKLYNKDAPSRLHSIYVSDEESLYHWAQYIGISSRLFEVEVNGDVFVSSDILFPDIKASFEEQVLTSIEYWQPKRLMKTSPKEYLVQGKIEIKGEMEI